MKSNMKEKRNDMSHAFHVHTYSTFGRLCLGAMSKTDGIADQTDTISVL